MSTIGELATAHSTHVLPTMPVAEAARFMAELGIGDDVIANSVSGDRRQRLEH